MNQEDLKHNLLDPQHWLRILFMAAYALAAWVVGCLLGVLVVVQLVLALITGAPNPNLQKAGYQLVRYLEQILQFLLYNSEEKPFPAADFPSADGFEPPSRKPRPEPAPAPAPAAAAPAASEPAASEPAVETPAAETPVADAPLAEAPAAAPADEGSAAADTTSDTDAGGNDAGDTTGRHDQDKQS